MKLAISAQGNDPNSPVDPRFGRAQCFVVVDTDTDEVTAVDNQQNLQAAQGAGVQSAQRVADLGVDAVLTGNVGPKACHVLNAAGIAIYLVQADSVATAVEAFKAGSLQQVTQANVEGHWM